MHRWRRNLQRLTCLAGLGLSALMSNPLIAQDNAANQDEPPRYSERGADTCLSCHNDERMLLIFQTPHGEGMDPNTPFAHLQCESCHGPGGEHTSRRQVGAGHPPIRDFGPGSTTDTRVQNGACLQCHSRHMDVGWEGSAHQRNEVSCADCHKVHVPVDPVSRVSQQSRVCFDCHRRQAADSLKPSAHPLREGHMACTDCHQPHHSTSEALLKAHTVNQLCTGCHAEVRGPHLFEHAPVTEDCTLCHQSHGSIHQALLQQRPPLLCQRCHSQAGHPSLAFTDDGLPGGTPSAFVVGGSCTNCHSQVHGSNHPSGTKLMR